MDRKFGRGPACAKRSLTGAGALALGMVLALAGQALAEDASSNEVVVTGSRWIRRQARSCDSSDSLGGSSSVLSTGARVCTRCSVRRPGCASVSGPSVVGAGSFPRSF